MIRTVDNYYFRFCYYKLFQTDTKTFTDKVLKSSRIHLMPLKWYSLRASKACTSYVYSNYVSLLLKSISPHKNKSILNSLKKWITCKMSRMNRRNYLQITVSNASLTRMQEESMYVTIFILWFLSIRIAKIICLFSRYDSSYQGSKTTEHFRAAVVLERIVVSCIWTRAWNWAVLDTCQLICLDSMQFYRANQNDAKLN